MKNGGGDLRKKLIFGSRCGQGLPGLDLLMNLSLLVSLFPCVGNTPGWLGLTAQKWWKQVGVCQRCQRNVTYESGIICANFGCPRGRFLPCEAAWCADCFVPHDMDCFEIKMPADFYGVDLTEEEDVH